MGNFEGTIIVRSSDGSQLGDYIFVPELDDILNVDSVGEPISNFPPGSVAYIAVNHSNNIQIDEVVSTDGSVQFHGTGSRDKEVSNLFASRDSADPDTYSFSIIPDGFVTSYLGRMGSISSAANDFGKITLTGDVSKTPFMASINVGYSVKIYKLIIPDIELEEDESYPIAVIFYISMVA